MDDGFSILAVMEGSIPTVGLRLGALEVARATVEPRLCRELITLQTRGGPGADIEVLGRAVGSLLFPDPVLDAFQVQGGRMLAKGGRIRVTLEAHDPQLASLPWELCHVSRRRPSDPFEGPLALHPRVRLFRGKLPTDPAPTPPPGLLRVLYVAADPGAAGFPRLGWLEAEQRAVAAAMHSARRPSVEMRTVLDAVPAVLARVLAEFRPDVVHFAGHGIARPSGGHLVLQGQAPATASFVTARDLSGWLRSSGVRMAILSACETDGTASEISNAGVQAVLGMRGAMRDACQPSFMRVLYGAVVEGAQISDAVAEARQALPTSGADWAVPVVYCNEDIRLFAGGIRDVVRPRIPFTDRPIVGRDREVNHIVGLICRSHAQIVSLTGLGGIGKTRLAAEAAAVAAPSFPDGVCFVDCEGITEAEGLYVAILLSMKIEVSNGMPADTFALEMQRSRRLLVLDGCDDLIASDGSSLICEVLDRAPSCAAIVSSRSPLRLSTEVAHLPVEALPVQEDPRDASPSVDLLLQSSNLDPYTLSPAERQAAGEICIKLDGIPLAIVLCAGRLNAVSLEELRDLVVQAPLRISGTGWSKSRQSTVAQAIACSLELVPVPDQELLRRLGVFTGGFSWGDAVAVLSDDPLDLIDALKRLTDCALLRTETVQERKRFRLLDTVREYVLSFGTPEVDSVRRHAQHFSAVAGRVQTQGRAGFGQLRPDLANFRAAARFADQSSMHGEAGTLADCLCRTLLEAGLTNDFMLFLGIGMRAAEAGKDRKLAARLLGLEGAHAARIGNEERCRESWARRAALCDEVGDFAGAADALTDLAVQAHQRCDPEECQRLLDHAIQRLEPSGSPELRATILVMQARLALDTGNFVRASAFGAEAEALSGQASDRDPMLFVDMNLGRIWAGCGQPARAEHTFARLLREAAHTERRTHVGVALLELATLHESVDQVELALMDLTAAVRIFEALRSRRLADAETKLGAFRTRHPDHPSIWITSLTVPWHKIVEEVLRRVGP